MPSIARPRHIVVDTGPIVALFDASDVHHKRAVEFVHGTRASLLSTIAVITEAMYVLQPSLLAGQNLLRWITTGGITLEPSHLDDLDRVVPLMEKYADLPMDFTDGVLVSLCDRLDIKHIATVDRDFSIYRFKGRSKFVNVFE